jgi:hypothetical protein
MTGELMSKRKGNGWLVGSGLFFGFYCLNVALGKFALMFKQEPLFSTGDVGEFLVLFAAVICLVIAVLLRESQQ